jgi:hypothetical protein
VPALELSTAEAGAEENENGNTCDDVGEGEISPGKGVTFASQSKLGKTGREPAPDGSEGAAAKARARTRGRRKW